jgi:hypothetical protein
MDAGQIARRLAEQAEQVAAYLLPNGRLQGREWVVGNVKGEKGQSLKICTSGSRSGLWSDFATGEKGDVLDLWCSVRCCSLSEAISEAKAYLGIQEPRVVLPRRRSYRKPEKPKATTPRSKVLEYLHSRALTERSLKAYQVAELAQRGKNLGRGLSFPSSVRTNWFLSNICILSEKMAKRKFVLRRSVNPLFLDRMSFLQIKGLSQLPRESLTR